MTQQEFIKEFESLMSKVEEDNENYKYHKYGVNSPAYILASYIDECLKAFIKSVESYNKYQNRYCIESDANP